MAGRKRNHTNRAIGEVRPEGRKMYENATAGVDAAQLSCFNLPQFAIPAPGPKP